MQLNIANPATGTQKKVEVDNSDKLCAPCATFDNFRRTYAEAVGLSSYSTGVRSSTSASPRRLRATRSARFVATPSLAAPRDFSRAYTAAAGSSRAALAHLFFVI